MMYVLKQNHVLQLWYETAMSQEREQVPNAYNRARFVFGDLSRTE